jgi:hypothetical protein
MTAGRSIFDEVPGRHGAGLPNPVDPRFGVLVGSGDPVELGEDDMRGAREVETN